MKIEDILLKEPRLFGLLDKASRVKMFLVSYERQEYWYKVIKPQFLKLVGFEAENEDLRDCATYDLMYAYFIKTMGI